MLKKKVSYSFSVDGGKSFKPFDKLTKLEIFAADSIYVKKGMVQGKRIQLFLDVYQSKVKFV